MGSSPSMWAARSAGSSGRRPRLRAFGRKIIHVGAIGSGQIAKTMNNLLLWACMCANYEVLTLAKSLGADVPKLVEALGQGSGANWSLSRWGTGTGKWAEKDMDVALDIAQHAKVPMPLVRAGRPVGQIDQSGEDEGAAGLNRGCIRTCPNYRFNSRDRTAFLLPLPLAGRAGAYGVDTSLRARAYLRPACGERSDPQRPGGGLSASPSAWIGPLAADPSSPQAGRGSRGAAHMRSTN